MRRTLLASALLIIPLAAVALDYSDQTSRYGDAPFRYGDAAGISVLTSLGAVEGNPDGTFQPGRTLNRAEFLKIALASTPNIRVSTSDASNCFPDVQSEDWFSSYVCLAKKRGVVSGYPDGTFKPANDVNYAEALKMLGELYGYTAYADPDAPWYTIYVQAAQNHKVLLPISLPYDALLSRGEMVRLAAAYRAEAEGELSYYREFEAGKRVVMDDNNASSSSSHFSSSQSSVTEEVPIEPDRLPLPTQSTHLMVGQRSGPIADGTFFPSESNAVFRSIKLELLREARSVEKFIVMDAYGAELGDMKLDIRDRDNKTWLLESPEGSSLVLPAREGTTIAFDAVIKQNGQGGFGGETVDVNRLTAVVSNDGDLTVSYGLVASSASFPPHQTSLAIITSVNSKQVGIGTLVSAPERHLASFSIEGSTATDNAKLLIRTVQFRVVTSGRVDVTNWKIGAESALRHSCTTGSSSDKLLVNCTLLPEEMGNVPTPDDKKTFDLYADVTGTGTASLQITLESAGSFESIGSLQWSDGSMEYTWMHSNDLPLVVGDWAR